MSTSRAKAQTWKDTPFSRSQVWNVQNTGRCEEGQRASSLGWDASNYTYSRKGEKKTDIDSQNMSPRYISRSYMWTRPRLCSNAAIYS